MLEKLQIRGFGANKKLDIEFGPNVTSIVGKSFIGKSWALRALRWVLCNKPQGDSFINWDSDEAKVRLSVDGKKVIRIRNRKSTNSYRFSDNKDSYVAFSNDVPKDIAEFLNVSDVLNIQGQHTLPFWFCETAGTVSRQLNQIVDLDIIDTTLANIADDLRTTNIIIKVADSDLEKVMEERKGLEYIEDIDVQLKHVEDLQRIYKENVVKRARIEEKLESIGKYTSIRESCSNLASRGANAVSMGDKYRKTATSVEKLLKAIESAQILQEALENRPPLIKPLKLLKEQTEQFTVRCDRLDILIESIMNRSEEKCRIEKELKDDKKELIRIAGGRCLWCGKKTS